MFSDCIASFSKFLFYFKETQTGNFRECEKTIICSASKKDPEAVLKKLANKCTLSF